MRKVFRIFGIGLAIAVGLFLVVCFIGFVGDLTADRQLKRMEKEARRYFSDFAAEGFKKPVIRGEMEEGNAWDFYSQAVKEVKALTEEQQSTIRNFLRQTEYEVGKPRVETGLRPSEVRHEQASLADDVVHILSTYAGALGKLRTGLRQNRCLTRTQHGPPYYREEWLAALLLAHGRLEQEGGNSQGATQDYLDVARFAQDLAGGHPTYAAKMEGRGYLAMTVKQIATDLTRFSFDRNDLERIAETLSILEKTWPSLAMGLRGDYWNIVISLSLRGLPRSTGLFVSSPLGPGPVPPVYVRALLRLGRWASFFSFRRGSLDLLSFCDRAVTLMEAVQEEEWEKVRPALDSLLSEASRSRSPTILAGVPKYVRLWQWKLKAIAWMKLAGAAALLEMYRLERGQYPSELNEAKKADLENLFSDPITGSPWQYRTFTEGDSAVVYSPGFDLKDDGWEKEDIALILPPPSQ